MAISKSHSKGHLTRLRRKAAICLKLTDEELLGLTVVAGRKNLTPANFLRGYVQRKVRTVSLLEKVVKEVQKYSVAAGE